MLPTNFPADSDNDVALKSATIRKKETGYSESPEGEIEGPADEKFAAGLNMVTFRMDRQTFALPIEPIQQIIEMVRVTPFPQMRGAVEGIINFHGAAVPVINMRLQMGLSKASYQMNTPIILVTVSGHQVGLIVDEVLDVMYCLEEQIIHPEDILPEDLGETPLLRGLIHKGDAIIMLLDIEHIFAVRHAHALADVASALQAKADEASVKLEAFAVQETGTSVDGKRANAGKKGETGESAGTQHNKIDGKRASGEKPVKKQSSSRRRAKNHDQKPSSAPADEDEAHPKG